MLGDYGASALTLDVGLEALVVQVVDTTLRLEPVGEATEAGPGAIAVGAVKDVEVVVLVMDHGGAMPVVGRFRLRGDAQGQHQAKSKDRRNHQFAKPTHKRLLFFSGKMRE